MSLDPILEASLAVQLHFVTVVPAFALGTWLIFASRKGAKPHRTLGAVYLALMTITATAAIFVQELNPGHFIWLHAFVALTYWSVFRALWSIRRKRIDLHKRAMLGLYIGGLLIAGGFTFLPGRVMYRMFFN